MVSTRQIHFKDGWKEAIEHVWEIASEYGHRPLCTEDCDAGCELIRKLWNLRESTHKAEAGGKDGSD